MNSFTKHRPEKKEREMKITPFNKKAHDRLQETFGISPMKFIDSYSSLAANRQVMDICSFDDWLQKRFSYEDGKTSMSDFLETFGVGVREAVMELSNIKRESKCEA